jgi:TetR/AcrR family transcriptional regulator, mexJK operon transcriptional repressor
MTVTAPSETGRKARGRRRRSPEVQRQAILQAAGDVFLERGYTSASVDAVADRARRSKATVYAIFGSKDRLLAALVAQGAASLAASFNGLPAGASLEENLRVIGRSYLDLILQPKRLALYRLVAGESGRSPDIGDTFYRTGPQAVAARVAAFFRAAAVRGFMETPDPERLAQFFLAAVGTDYHIRLLFDPASMPTAEEIEHHLDFVVATFVRCCRPASSENAHEAAVGEWARPLDGSAR